ncbi:MAG: DUF2802 domain-containing protein [Gammaproteobacteria bacterium]
MTNLAAVYILTLTALILIVWLAIDRLKIKRDIRMLVEKAERTAQDMAGLCSAAVSIDHRLLSNDRQLKILLEKIAEIGNDESSGRPYNAVIQKIQEGADEDALMNSYGLSREEARLLIRLHGGVDDSVDGGSE